MFLAIAVDNLTNAQEIGDDEKAEEEEREKHKQEVKERYAPKNREYGFRPIKHVSQYSARAYIKRYRP